MADFSSASAAALADIEAASAEPVGSPEPAPDPTPTAAPDEPPTPAEPETPAAQPTDEELELKWNGQQLKFKREDVVKLAQQGFDYTQKTQALAQKEREWEQRLADTQARYQAEQAALRQALTDPNQVRALWERLQGQTQAQPGVDPNDVPTVAQMRQALQLEAQRMQQATEQRIQQVAAQTMAQIESARLETDYTQAAEQTIGQLVERHGILKAVEDIEVLLRQDAWKAIQAKHAVDPSYAPSKEDVTQALAQAAERRAGRLGEQIKTHERTAIARSAKLTTHGTEPPGGRAVTPVPSAKAKLGSRELTSAAIEDVERMMRSITS